MLYSISYSKEGSSEWYGDDVIVEHTDTFTRVQFRDKVAKALLLLRESGIKSPGQRQIADKLIATDGFRYPEFVISYLRDGDGTDQYELEPNFIELEDVSRMEIVKSFYDRELIEAPSVVCVWHKNETDLIVLKRRASIKIKDLDFEDFVTVSSKEQFRNATHRAGNPSIMIILSGAALSKKCRDIINSLDITTE